VNDALELACEAYQDAAIARLQDGNHLSGACECSQRGHDWPAQERCRRCDLQWGEHLEGPDALGRYAPCPKCISPEVLRRWRDMPEYPREVLRVRLRPVVEALVKDDWIRAHQEGACGHAPFICPVCHGIRVSGNLAEVARLKEIIDVARETLNRDGARGIGYVVDAFAGACDAADTDAFSGVWGLCGRLVHAIRANLAKMPTETTDQKFAIKRYMLTVEAVLQAALEMEQVTPDYMKLEALADSKLLQRHLREIDDAVAAAVRIEREACALIADRGDVIDSLHAVACYEIAEEIRARGTK